VAEELTMATQTRQQVSATFRSTGTVVFKPKPSPAVARAVDSVAPKVSAPAPSFVSKDDEQPTDSRVTTVYLPKEDAPRVSNNAGAVVDGTFTQKANDVQPVVSARLDEQKVEKTATTIATATTDQVFKGALEATAKKEGFDTANALLADAQKRGAQGAKAREFYANAYSYADTAQRGPDASYATTLTALAAKVRGLEAGKDADADLQAGWGLWKKDATADAAKRIANLLTMLDAAAAASAELARQEAQDDEQYLLTFVANTQRAIDDAQTKARDAQAAQARFDVTNGADDGVLFSAKLAAVDAASKAQKALDDVARLDAGTSSDSRLQKLWPAWRAKNPTAFGGSASGGSSGGSSSSGPLLVGALLLFKLLHFF
jgi:hypothetical protein